MTKPEAIVFDLDGTLIHSAPDLRFAANEALKAVDRRQLDLPTIISFIGNGVEVLVERILDATGDSSEALKRDVLAIFLKVYGANMTTLTRPYPGVVAALEQLKSSGVRLGVCTNKPTAPAREICEKLDLVQFFDVIVGAESDQPKKPDPQSLLTCIAALNCTPEQALYVGDSAIDFHTARRASVDFRLFSAGYLNESLPELSDENRFSNWAKYEINFFFNFKRESSL